MHFHHFQSPIFLLLAWVLTACGGPDSEVNIDIAIEKSLQSDIRVTAKSGKKPGVTNPIEVSVTLENAGASDHQILLAGQWQNEAGNRFGGSSDSRLLKARSSTTYTAGSRSQRVTKLALRISETTLDSDQLTALTLSEVKPAIPGYGLSYTATPSLDQIPNWPPKGNANGVPFVAGTILFAPINGVWELQVMDREIDPLKGLALARSLEGNAGLQSIHLNLPDEPQTGKVFDRKLSYGGGHFQIRSSPDSSDTTSWNTEIAWVVEIKRWNRQPYRETGSTMQKGGSASGRLYICFKGSGEKMQSSFVAGVFENAPIVYYGNPNRRE